MDDPAAFPDSEAPIDVDVSLRDVERVVDFISALRGISSICYGCRQPTSKLRAMRIQHPDKVARLVLSQGIKEKSDEPGGTRGSRLQMAR